jgi:hypothetical protein
MKLKFFATFFLFVLLITYKAQAQGQVSPTSLNPGTVGFLYTPVPFTSLKVTSAPYWSATISPPNSGLTVNSLGILSGTPKISGNITIQLSVKSLTRNNTSTDNRTVTLSVNSTLPPTITTNQSQLPAGKMDVEYANPSAKVISYQFAASGGVPFPLIPRPTGYIWSLYSGKLPVGMTLNSVGVLSGIPTQQGNFTITIRATDAVGKFADKVFTLFIAPPDSPVITTDCPLPSGLEKFKYPNAAINVQNGKRPYRWSIISGNLPPGLTLENSSGSAGIVKGTPTIRGNFTFTLKVTDANGMSATKNCSITIQPSPEQTLKITKIA